MKEELNLYKVILTGMRFNPTGTIYGESFVIAPNPTVAIDKVQDWLVTNKIGTTDQRVLSSIEFIASTSQYGGCRHMLFTDDGVEQINSKCTERLKEERQAQQIKTQKFEEETVKKIKRCQAINKILNESNRIVETQKMKTSVVKGRNKWDKSKSLY